MGGFPSTLKYIYAGTVQMRPPKAKFSTDQIPDLTGRVAIVTGSSTGIGKETVKTLLEHNAKVYLAARSRAKAEAAIAELKASTGKEAIFLELDVSSFVAIRKAAETFLSEEKELHLLFNNAGIMWPPIDPLTADGFDIQFGTNVAGHFLFTKLLVSALAAGAKTSPDGYSRIVTTSSNGAYLGTLNYNTFKDTPACKKSNTQALYNQSKLANAVVAHEASKRYADKNILSFSCNPGALRTELQRHATAFQAAMLSPLLYPAPYGALTQLYAATMPEAIKYNGEFLIPWARIGRCLR